MVFDATVIAMVESIIRELCVDAEIHSPEMRAVVSRYVLDQHARMADYLRLPLKAMTLVFCLWSIPLEGRPFHRLPHERRLRQIRAWRKSALGTRQNLVKFFETLVVWGWYSEVYRPDERRADLRS